LTVVLPDEVWFVFTLIRTHFQACAGLEPYVELALAVWYQFEVPRGLGGLPEHPLPVPRYPASTQISSSGYALPLVTHGVSLSPFKGLVMYVTALAEPNIGGAELGVAAPGST